MIQVLLLAAVQLQTMRLPPRPAPIATAPSQVSEVTAFPDLLISGIRVVGETNAEFEVKNQGQAASGQAVPLVACAYAGDKHYCSSSRSVGVLGPGESKWVRFDCFYSPPRMTSGSGGGLFGSVEVRTGSTAPQCDTPGSITKYTARVDTKPSMADDYFEKNGPSAPAALRPDCSEEYGCVRESNEANNRAEFEAPFSN
ncbi:MAG: hypothetical protein ABIO43_08790 [Sphingomicrobium sp.]